MGGKCKNKPKAKREGTTGRRGAAAMTVVAVVKDRETKKVRAKVVEGTDTKTLQGSIRETVAPCATPCTDEAAAYRGMPEYVHEAFNHGGRPSGDRSVGRRMSAVQVPPLKIQGIKTKAVPFIRDSFVWNGSWRWIEPFVGSAVVALNINPERALLGDTNPHLVRFHAAIHARTVTSATVRAFLKREGAHLLHDGHDHFYRIRDRFNDSGDPHDFLFLNRACVNGLMRFNKKGHFNTPFCRKPDRFRPAYVSKICNQVQRAADRMAGRAWKFVCADWRDAGRGARRRFRLLRPALYRVLHGLFQFMDGRRLRAIGGWPKGAALLVPLFNVVGEQISEKRRLHEAFSDYEIRTFSHFYHLGATEELRNGMTEALVAG